MKSKIEYSGTLPSTLLMLFIFDLNTISHHFDSFVRVKMLKFLDTSWIRDISICTAIYVVTVSTGLFERRNLRRHNESIYFDENSMNTTKKYLRREH